MEAETHNSIISEIKSWLKIALSSENLNDFSIELDGSNEKGEGYVGDVFFIKLITDQNKIYNLVLKCSKRSVALREKTPAMKSANLNEIYIYTKVFPTFQQFETERSVQKPFDTFPLLYGTFISENLEVLVLENMKTSGYVLWDRRKPLNSEHLLKVVHQYGRFHAISVALQDQKPEEYVKLRDGLLNVLEDFQKGSNFNAVYRPAVERTCSELAGELDEDTLRSWSKLADQVDYILGDMYSNNKNRVSVINHADCWNNNFMYYYGENNEVIKVVMLDWQMTWCSTPISDLSYFLFATISEDDIQRLDTILKEYYRSFSDHLQKLGSDPEKLYPFEQFTADWKKYCRFGLLIINLVHKMCVAEKEEVKSVDEVVESGEDMKETFNYEIQNKDAFRQRIKPIVKYAVDNNLV